MLESRLDADEGVVLGFSILVVDDDPDIRQLVSWRLEADGFVVVAVGDGRAALSALAADDVALVILDLSLPDMSGLDVLRAVRESTPVPVIIVSGRGAESDRIVGLDLGADDYLVKPFSPGELAARVRSVLRRAAVSAGCVLDLGTLVIDLDAREVVLDGAVVEMSPKEFELLAFLASSPRRAYTRAQLLQRVWHSSPGWQHESTVTQHVHRLRQKIEPDPEAPRWLKTVSRVGYRFEP